MTQVPILTYHATNMDGNEYHNNDHVSLSEDLKLIHDLAFRIISLDVLMAWHCGKVPDTDVKNAVVLTCDDGTSFDYYDIEHQIHGPQTSFFNILKSHKKTTGHDVHMTNFVIVSPEARVVLDEQCLIGQGWWKDDWWQAAQDSGLMHIANHSWDHNHGVFDNDNHNDDTFHHIDTLKQCDRQLRDSQRFLHDHFSQGYSNHYFAYPYGNFSDYLRFEYLPQHGREIGLKAALSAAPEHVNKLSDVWALPRYVCNNDWHSSNDLRKILTQNFGS